MRVDIGPRWAPTDEPIYFVHNFTDVRVDMDVTFVDIKHDALEEEGRYNDTIPMFPQDYRTGQFLLLNDTAIREFHFVISGHYPVEGKYIEQRYIKFYGHRCKDEGCFEDDPLLGLDVTEEPRFWSIPEHWSDGRNITMPIPITGENVTISEGWNMHLDMEEPPILE